MRTTQRITALALCLAAVACSAAADRALAPTTAAREIAPPPPPSNVTPTIVALTHGFAAQIVVRWTDNSGGAALTTVDYVQIVPGSVTEWQVFGSASPGVDSVTEFKVVPKYTTSLCFRAKVLYQGQSDYSAATDPVCIPASKSKTAATKTIVTTTDAPTAPTNFKVAIPKVTSANVGIGKATWTDNSGGTAQTQLQIYTDYWNSVAGSPGVFDWYVVDNAPPGATSIDFVANITPAMTQVCFRLRALYAEPVLIASPYVETCIDPKRTHRQQ